MNKGKTVFIFFGLIALLVGTLIFARLKKIDHNAAPNVIALEEDQAEDELLSTDEDCCTHIQLKRKIISFITKGRLNQKKVKSVVKMQPK